MRYFLLSIAILISVSQIQAQTLSGTVLDQEGRPLPYATVYNVSKQKGTATSERGTFELRGVDLGDSLECTYIGYVTQTVVVSDYNPKEIVLKFSNTLMDEISITADNDFLYDWIAKVRKNKKTKDRLSKTYYYLESSIDDHTTEVLESYSNGRYGNHNANYLSIKKGRVGIDSINGRYFLSTGTSQAMLRHNIWDANSPFPGNPLNLKKKKLKKTFDLALLSRYQNGDEVITVIAFSPKDEKNQSFSGTIAFDSEYRLRKIELSIENTLKHPFQSFGGITLQSMDIRLSKTFKIIKKQPYIDNINFDYDIQYLDRDNTPVTVKTKAYINAYDFDNLFKIPVFRFSNHIHRDYRDMTVVPYDSIFWSKIDEFRLFERGEFIDQYIADHKIENSLSTSTADLKMRSLEFPYLNWDTTRFAIAQLPDDQLEIVAEKHPFADDRYYFDFKIYIDSYTLKDSTYYTSAAILDPVNTRYELRIEQSDIDWMNMYFDLLELERRKMMNRIALAEKPLLRNMLLEEQIIARREFTTRSKLFKAQTQRGVNELAMQKWKATISRELFATR